MTDTTTLLMQAKYGGGTPVPLVEDNIPDLTDEDFEGKSVAEVWAMKLVHAARKAQIAKINQERLLFLTSSVDDEGLRLAR